MFAQQTAGWPAAVPMEHDFVWTTLGTLVVYGLVIAVTAFLLGLIFGRLWHERQ